MVYFRNKGKITMIGELVSLQDLPILYMHIVTEFVYIKFSLTNEISSPESKN